MTAGSSTSKLSEKEGHVARLVRDAGTIARSDLGRRSGLGRPSLTAALQVLEEVGLVSELGTGASTGGRPPSLVRFQPTAAYVLGIELGATSVDVAISDLLATPVQHAAATIDVKDGPDIVLKVICELIDGLLEDGSVSADQISGLGIGLPGPVEFNSVRQVSPPIMRGWDRFPVREFFHDRYGWPVFIDNDVNLMALGEAAGGVTAENFLYVKLGSGIGCGIMCSGRLHRGHNGSAGDIGHTAVGGSLAPCHCGNIGCLEAVAGGHALGRAAGDLARSGSSTELSRAAGMRAELTAVDIGAALRNGDLGAVELVKSAGSAIGEVLAGLVNFFNPSMIILGGGLINVGDLLMAAIRESVYRRSLPLATRDLSVVTGALGSKAGVVGAAALVLDQLYHLRRTANGC